MNELKNKLFIFLVLIVKNLSSEFPNSLIFTMFRKITKYFIKKENSSVISSREMNTRQMLVEYLEKCKFSKLVKWKTKKIQT